MKINMPSDGLNYALSRLYERVKYFKELMTLYLHGDLKVELDGFTFHPTPDSFLAPAVISKRQGTTAITEYPIIFASTI
ncbi:MAG: hypothetical protein ACLR6B_04090 [Blautia sp.]